MQSLKFIIKCLGAINLVFKDKEMEKKYKASKIQHQKIILIIIFFFGILVVFFGWLIDPFDRHFYTGTFLIFMIILLIYTIFMIFLMRRKPNCTENIIIITSLFYLVGFLESVKSNIDSWNSIMFFVTGINIELILGIILLSKASWMKCSFVFLLINLLCCFRYTKFDDNETLKFYPLLQHVGNIFFLCVAAFFIENEHRRKFLEIQNYEFSLRSFRDLIKYSFPSAVFIIHEGELLFENDEAIKFFSNVLENDSVFNLLKTIKIEATSAKLRDNFTEEPDNKKNKNSTKELIISLESIIKKMERVGIGDRSGATTYYGSCDLFEESKRDLEIKISRIFWENRHSIMIIISENRILKKIKALNNQSEYKDKLLATVSHDLRTPLNGIIGMIIMTLEEISDRTLKK